MAPVKMEKPTRGTRGLSSIPEVPEANPMTDSNKVELRILSFITPDNMFLKAFSPLVLKAI
jgi:hypothetical protein